MLFPIFTFAHLALCAAAIFLRVAAERVRFAWCQTSNQSLCLSKFRRTHLFSRCGWGSMGRCSNAKHPATKPRQEFVGNMRRKSKRRSSSQPSPLPISPSVPLQSSCARLIDSVPWACSTGKVSSFIDEKSFFVLQVHSFLRISFAHGADL